jgi:GT2 family glycosyltransferase
VWQELGGFDESFFPLWFEDVDFCRRAIDRGYQFVLRPGGRRKTHGAGIRFAAISRETPRLLVW